MQDRAAVDLTCFGSDNFAFFLTDCRVRSPTGQKVGGGPRLDTTAGLRPRPFSLMLRAMPELDVLASRVFGGDGAEC